MSQKLPKFLKDNDCQLLIKYDGERNRNKYTIKLLNNNLNKKNLGKDTDDPYSVINEILENTGDFPVSEVSNLFSVMSDDFFGNAIIKFGNQCVATAKTEERNEELFYTFHVQTDQASKYTSGLNIEEGLETILL